MIELYLKSHIANIAEAYSLSYVGLKLDVSKSMKLKQPKQYN